MTEVPFTPAVVVDLPTVRRNLSTLFTYARRHNLNVRPHTKTHKSLRAARMQVEAGAAGLTVAKVGEADIMARATKDLLVAYPALDPHRAGRLAQLARTHTVRVGLDSAFAARQIGGVARALGVTVGVLADLDVGHHRTGVQSPHDLLRLAEAVDQTPGLRLDGIMCFPGHIKGPDAEKIEALKPVEALLAESVALFRKAGLSTAIVSGGSSPTCWVSHHTPSLTEIRPGTNVYNDMNQVRGGCCAVDDCAARVVCTVISDAVPGKFVIDGGSKTFTSDRCAFNPDANGFGRVVEYPDARIVRLSEEHAEVDASKCAARPGLGDRVTVIPNHVCPCINLHESVFFRDDAGDLEQSPVDARGKVV